MRRREREKRTEDADDRAGWKLTIRNSGPWREEAKGKEEEDVASLLSLCHDYHIKLADRTRPYTIYVEKKKIDACQVS